MLIPVFEERCASAWVRALVAVRAVCTSVWASVSACMCVHVHMCVQ